MLLWKDNQSTDGLIRTDSFAHEYKRLTVRSLRRNDESLCQIYHTGIRDFTMLFWLGFSNSNEFFFSAKFSELIYVSLRNCTHQINVCIRNNTSAANIEIMRHSGFHLIYTKNYRCPQKTTNLEQSIFLLSRNCGKKYFTSHEPQFISANTNW